jgi:hypothetical protein
MTFDYILRRAGSAARCGFTVEAANRDDADEELVRRMLVSGWKLTEVLHWSIVAVTERGREG